MLTLVLPTSQTQHCFTARLVLLPFWPLILCSSPQLPPQLSPGCIRLSLANRAGNRKYILLHRQNSGHTRCINTHTHASTSNNPTVLEDEYCLSATKGKYDDAPEQQQILNCSEASDTHCRLAHCNTNAVFMPKFRGDLKGAVHPNIKIHSLSPHHRWLLGEVF